MHVANAACDNTACLPRSALQAQAQAQPRAASFRVSCAVHGRHREMDARVTVLALTTTQPCLVVRVSGAGWASAAAGVGPRPVAEGDYVYEWPILPTGGGGGGAGGGSSSRNRRRGGGGGGGGMAAGSPPHAMACMAVSEDLRRLLCVTREGNAYGLHVGRVVKGAQRVHDTQADQEEEAHSHKTAGQVVPPPPPNLRGPSLLAFSMDPKYHVDGSSPLPLLSGGAGGGGSGQASAPPRRAKDISLGSNSTEGDFVPRCCVWWTPTTKFREGASNRVQSPPTACTSMAIVGGTSGGRGALSILDMDQEREVDLLYIPATEGADDEGNGKGQDGRRGVVALEIHTVGDASAGQRVLLVTLGSGRLYSLVLESSADPLAPLSLSTSTLPPHATESPPRTTTTRRHSGPPSVAATPQKLTFPRAASSGVPSSSPTTPPPSSPHSSTATEVPSPSSQSIGSLLLNTPQRGRKKGKRKNSGGRSVGESEGVGFARGLDESGGSSRGARVEEEREAASLWDRCFARTDPYSALGQPRQPRVHTCFASADGLFETRCPLFENREGCSLEDTNVVAAVQAIPPTHADTKHSQAAAFGLVLSRLGQDGRAATMEVHYCALDGEAGAGGIPPCRRLCRLALGEDLDSLLSLDQVCVSRVVEATLMPEKMLVLSVAACRPRTAPAWGEEESWDGASSSSYWLMVYRLPPDDQGKDKEGAEVPLCPLLRAFPSPTKAPLSFLGWLVPVTPDIRDVLALARTRTFSSLGGDASSSSSSSVVVPGPDEVLVWSLVVWSHCSIFFVRILANKEEETMSTSPRPGRRGDFVLPEFPLPSALPSSLQTHSLAPGEMVALIKSLGKEGKVNEALALAWNLLLRDQDSSTGGGACPEGPALHPAYFGRLVGADPWLAAGGPGRAHVALQCVRWMVGPSAPAAWTKEELLRFLETCPDYRLERVVAVLLAHHRVSEALFASWVRGKVPGVAKTLNHLARLASASCPSTSTSSSPSGASMLMPLSRSDVAWLCGVGAGQCIIQEGCSVLWAVLPLRLQLGILLSDPRLLLLPDQYQWLLATLPELPRPCLGALVLQLAHWLGLGPSPTREPPPPLPMSPRMVVKDEGPGAAGGVPLVAAWSSQEGVVAGLAIAVDTLARAPTQQESEASHKDEGEQQATEREEEEETQQESEASHKDEGEQQATEREEEEESWLPRRHLLSDLLLEILLTLAQPLTGTRAVLEAHALAKCKATSATASLSRPAGLALPQQEAFESQVLLEQLLRAWTTTTTTTTTAAAHGSAPSSSAHTTRNVHFTPAIVLVRASTAKNAGAAALLLEAAGKWERALEVRLEEVAAIAGAAGGTRDAMQTQADEAVLVGLLQTHVLHRESLEWSTRRRMVATVLLSWARLGLSPAPLEAFVLNETDRSAWDWHMGVALFTDVLVLHAGAPGAPVDAQGAVVVPGTATDQPPLRFSPSFYTRLAQHMLAHGRTMQLEGVTDLWSTGGKAPALLRFPRPLAALWKALHQQVQGLEEAQAAVNRIEVPTQRLLAAAASEKRRGSLSASSSAAFSSSSLNPSGTGRRLLVPAGEYADAPIVAFSCGHVVGQMELLQQCLPALEATLTTGVARPLRVTAEMLCQEYREVTGVGTGALALACPACVQTLLVGMVEEMEAATTTQ